MFGTFFCLAAVKLQISSTCTRLDRTPHTFSSWKAAHASPASTSIFATVLIDTPTTREIDRIEALSQRIERIWTRLARGSLFMLHIDELLCLASRTLFSFAAAPTFGTLCRFDERKPC